jgi:NADH-quinone oxidoreductase subunit J
MLSIFKLIQWLLLFGALISIFGVISRRFLIEKIFNLIAVFIILAFCLILYGFEFLPLVILLLYVGAIAVLFLFVVIIVNPDYTEIINEKRNLYHAWQQKNNQLSVAPVLDNTIRNYSGFFDTILSLKGIVYVILGSSFIIFNTYFYEFHIFIININQKEDLFTIKLRNNTNILDILYVAELMYQEYGLSLIVIGAILLVAIIGAILLTLRKTVGLKRQTLSAQFLRYR